MLWYIALIKWPAGLRRQPPAWPEEDGGFDEKRKREGFGIGKKRQEGGSAVGNKRCSGGPSSPLWTAPLVSSNLSSYLSLFSSSFSFVDDKIWISSRIS